MVQYTFVVCAFESKHIQQKTDKLSDAFKAVLIEDKSSGGKTKEKKNSQRKFE